MKKTILQSIHFYYDLHHCMKFDILIRKWIQLVKWRIMSTVHLYYDLANRVRLAISSLDWAQLMNEGILTNVHFFCGIFWCHQFDTLLSNRCQFGDKVMMRSRYVLHNHDQYGQLYVLNQRKPNGWIVLLSRLVSSIAISDGISHNWHTL